MLRRFSRVAALCASAAAIVTLSSLLPVMASASVGGHADTVSTSASSYGAEQAALYPIQRTMPVAVTTSCTTLRHELSRLAHDGRKSAACTEAAPASLAARVSRPLATSLCVAGKIQRTRHAACAITAISYEVIQLPSGDVLGTGVIVFGYAETLSSSSWKWTLTAAIELTEATGVVLEGTVATTDVHCTNSTTSAPWVRPLADDVAYSHDFAITGRGGAVTTTRQTPVIEVINPAATDQAPPVTLSDLGPARCDSIAVAGTRGCVFSDVAAVYYVYLTGHNEGDVAKNVQDGERTKPHHFGWYGHGKPLTRATNSKVQSKNRQAACGKKRYKKPLTCDEYPFAATYQGAYYYPQDSITAGVPGSQNSAEGAYRVNMYRTERLLNLDPYWVVVEP